jgi:four helix bundle protein
VKREEEHWKWRWAAVSVPSTIAEGQARRSTKEFVHFISQAEGSLAELETQLLIAEELSFAAKNSNDVVFELIHEIQRMLNALRRKLTTDP